MAQVEIAGDRLVIGLDRADRLWSFHSELAAAQGPQAANVAGVSDQTDLFHTMARALGLSG